MNILHVTTEKIYFNNEKKEKPCLEGMWFKQNKRKFQRFILNSAENVQV